MQVVNSEAAKRKGRVILKLADAFRMRNAPGVNDRQRSFQVMTAVEETAIAGKHRRLWIFKLTHHIDGFSRLLDFSA